MLTWCPDRERKESKESTSSLNGPFFRPELKNHPWRGSSSWEDRMLRQNSSFRTFTSCCTLLSPSANMLLFSCYWATDIGRTRLFPCPPVSARLLLSPSCQHSRACSFIRGILSRRVHCSRGERLWPLVYHLAIRERRPSCILSGASGQKKKSNRTLLSPLTGKSADNAVFLWWKVNNVKLFVNINND